MKYIVSSMQPNLALETTHRCRCLTLLHANWGEGAHLKNMDLKKPLSMEDWFIMTESSWLYPL